MSKEVDQRIVEMQFNNADFEQKVSKSISSLKQLKDASQMEDAGKGVEKLVANIKGVDFSAMAQGIQQLNDRFSNLGIVGITIMQRLTNAAIDAGAKIGEAITAAPRDGWKEYELNLDSVKTILNSAKGADGLPVTLDKVNEKLAELNTYSDQTIYSFSDMTNNIGKFTNAGVDLDSAVTAIQGVANVAALSGANANDAARAMYNFGQALGSGSVKLIDWKSIENANMATVGFKEQLIDTAVQLGVLRQEGDKYISTTTDMSGKVSDAFNATQGFNDSLSAQWMTTEVLTKTLEKYTKRGTELGDAAFEAATKVTTFSKMIDTLKESMGSGWMQTFQIIFGDFEEASELWTGVYNRIDKVIQKVSGLRNAFFQSWKDSGGRDALINSIKNIWDTVEYYFGLIAKAFEIVFPVIDTTPIVAVEKGLESITEKLKPIIDTTEVAKDVVQQTSEAVQEVVDHTEEFNNLVERIKMGEFGNGEERIQRLKEAGYAYENLQNAVNETLGVEKRYETAVSDNVAIGYEDIEVKEQIAEANEQHAASIDDINEATKDLNPVTANLVKILLAVKSTTGLVKKGFSAAWGVIGRGATVAQTIVAALKFVLNILGGIAGKVYEFTSWLGKFKTFNAFIIALQMRLSQLSGQLGVPLDAIQEFFRNIKDIIKPLKDEIVAFFEPFKNFDPNGVFTVLYEVLKGIAMVLGGVLLVSLNLIASVLNTVIHYSRLLWDTFKNLSIVKSVAESFKSFKAELKGYKDQLKQAKAYTDIFAPAMEEVAKAVAHLKELFGPIIQRALDGFVLYVIKGAHALDEFANAAKKSKTWQSFTNLFLKFKLAIKDIPELIAKVFESIQKNGKLPELKDLPNTFQFLVVAFNNFKKVLTGNFTDLFQSLMEKFKSGFDMLGKVNFGPFQGLVDNLKSIFDDLKKLVLEGEGTIGQLITNVWGKLSQIDFRGGAITALIGSVALFAFRWSKVGKSAAFALKGLGKFFLNGGQVAQTAVDKYNGFLKIAAAIAIIAGSIWLIAEIPSDRFASSVATIATAFSVMFGTIELLSYQKIPEDKMKAIGMAFIGLGAGLAMVAVAAKIFAGMDWTEIGKGGLALVSFTAMVVLAARSAKDVGTGAGLAFMGLSAALFMLIPSIKLLAGMDAHTLIKGGAAVYAFVNIIAGAAKRAGDAKGAFGAFMGLSLALLLLIPSIKILSGMDAKTLIKGGLAVYVFLNMMANAAKQAQGGAKGFLGMGIAIGIIAVSLKLLSTIPWAALLASSNALKGVLKTVTEALVQVSQVSWGGIAKTIVALALVLGLVGGALYLMTTQIKDTDAMLKSALGVSAIMLTFALMGPAITALSKIDFMAGVTAAGNAMVFFGAMVLCLGALGEVASIGDGAAGAAIENGAGVFGRIIHNFLDGLMHGSEEPEKQAEKTVTLADKLSAFGDSIQGFLTTLTNVDYEAVDKAKALATAILTLTAADLVDALAGWFRGSNGLEDFATTIGPLTTAIIDMNEQLSTAELDTAKLDSVIKIVQSFSDLANALPKKGGLAQKLLGVQELSTFAKDMEKFISDGFTHFAVSVTALGSVLNFGLTAKVAILQNVTASMIKLAKSLPENGVISKLIDGPKDLGKFAANMKSFMESGFQEFCTAVNSMTTGINLEMLKGNIIPATEEMIKLGTKLKEGSSIIDFITGRTDLGKFGTTLADFGKGINDFSTSIVNVKLDHVNGMTDAMERLADLNASENLKTSNLGTFSSSINALGAAIAQFYTDSGAADPAQLGTIIGQITNLHNLLLILSGTDYSGVEGFTSALATLGSSSAQAFIDAFTSSLKDVEDAAISFMNTFLDTLDTFRGDIEWKGSSLVVVFCIGIEKFEAFLKGAGKYLVTGVSKGVDSSNTDAQKMGKHVVLEFCSGVNDMDGFLKGAGTHMVTKAIDGIKGEIDQFYDQGNYSAQGYARGIRDMASDAADEAARMVREAAEAARREQDSASPSKVYKGFGKDAVDGYILGFVNNTYKVVRAAKSMAKAGINTMQDAVDKTRSLIDGSMDYRPTITPVIDLSQLSSGVDQANLLLSDIHTDDLAASTAASIANAHNAVIAARVTQPMNYSKDLTDLIENTNKIINAVKQNRYAVIDGDEAFRYFDRRLGMA